MPPGVSVTLGGADACSLGAGGYHEDALVDPTADAGGEELVYAVILNCGQGATSGIATIDASHEIFEAATDPYPLTHPGYLSFDADHLANEIYQAAQSETGDACEFWQSSYDYEPAPFVFFVQRMWSNQRMREGHNPCAPRPLGAYYGLTPFADQLDPIHVDLTAVGVGPRTTKGYKVAIGQSRTFDIGFYSDAPIDGDWTVTAIVPPYMGLLGFMGPSLEPVPPIVNGQLTVTIDRPSGRNGHKAHVTVTPTAGGDLGAEWIILRASFPGEPDYPYFAPSPHDLPLLIAQQ
jgi:hypothetical protein